MVTLWQQVVSSNSLVVEVKEDEPWQETESCREQCLWEDGNKMGISPLADSISRREGGRAEEVACPWQGGIWLPQHLLC